MSAIELVIHGTGTGLCALTGREADGVTLTFEDGSVQSAFLSWKAFRQLAALKFGQAANGKMPPTASAATAAEKK